MNDALGNMLVLSTHISNGVGVVTLTMNGTVITDMSEADPAIIVQLFGMLVPLDLNHILTVCAPL